MGRKQDDELLAMINHRLGLLEQLSHRVSLIETVNDQLASVVGRLDAATVDREALQALALTIREVATAMADRLEETEARLRATERRLDEVARLVAEQRGPA